MKLIEKPDWRSSTQKTTISRRRRPKQKGDQNLARGGC
jgi:hypothetical protein